MSSSNLRLARSGSQGSDASRSGESVESPTTVGTLYTPEAGRFKSGGVSRTFAIASDASPPKAKSAFDTMSALCNALPVDVGASGLSATASAFTPTSSHFTPVKSSFTSTSSNFTPVNSRLAQLTATSTPDDNFPSTTRAASQLNGMASSSSFQLPTFDLGYQLTPQNAANGQGKMPAFPATLAPDATRYILVISNSAERLEVVHSLLNDAMKAASTVQQRATGFGGMLAYRFDSIGDANAALIEARSKLQTCGRPGIAQVTFMAASSYVDFDPTLTNLEEGTIGFSVTWNSQFIAAAQLRIIAEQEAACLGLIHSKEVMDESPGFISTKITYDSKKAADAALTELATPKAGFVYKIANIRAYPPPPKTVASRFRNDSVHLSGNGVKLPSSYTTTNGGNISDTLTLGARSAATKSFSPPDLGVNQPPAIHFSNAGWPATLPVRSGPPGLTSAPYTMNALMEAMAVPKATRANRNSNPVDEAKILAGQDIRTTIMLRNIPNKMTAAELKLIIDKTSFGKYDFSYLRIDFANQCNVGYAFINFTKPEYIINFLREHNGRPWGLYNSDKVAECSYATRQGLASLIDLFQNSCVMEEIPEHRPKLWYTENDGPWCGQEKPFPPPNNLQKLQRSRDMAATVGLYPPKGAHRGFHQDERHRMSQYDRGTPQALRDAQINMAQQYGMQYPAMAPGYPAFGSAMPYPYGYPGFPFYPAYM